MVERPDVLSVSSLNVSIELEPVVTPFWLKHVGWFPDDSVHRTRMHLPSVIVQAFAIPPHIEVVPLDRCG